MKTENEITVRTNSRGRCREEKLPLVEMKDTLDNGGRVTLLIRHAERPPLVEQFDSVWRGDFCRDCGRRKFCSDPVV